MKEKQRNIYALIQSIIRYLKTHGGSSPGVRSTLDKLAAMDLSKNQLVDVPPQGTRHNQILETAIDAISTPALNEIAGCLRASKDYLDWREDNAQFYPQGADLGDGYKNCNLHTVLIGPDACGYTHTDFSLGIFMLGPRTFYRDHCHDAPELYLNLSDKTGWRFKSGEWCDYPGGSFIWNAAGERHATRVYEQPFISVFVWTEKVHSLCNVMPFNDWAEIEHELTLQSTETDCHVSRKG